MELKVDFDNGESMSEIPRLVWNLEDSNSCIEQFIVKHLSRNIPVVIDAKHIFKAYREGTLTHEELAAFGQWNSLKDWVGNDEKLNIEFLKEHFGSTSVCVSECNVQEFSDQKKIDGATLQQYFDEYFPLKNEGLFFYLKDWHFVRNYPDYSAYRVPPMFSDDWINQHWDYKLQMGSEASDYRFVYVGPKESWTPCHRDVFGSYSWSVNIVGKKLWYLFNPQASEGLRKHKIRQNCTVYDVRHFELNKAEFPEFEDSWKKRIEYVQVPGEFLFVPSHWFHQVHNLEDTLSINHNWSNGFNLKVMWKQMLEELDLVKESISDCKTNESDYDEEWEGQCQFILKHSSGINLSEFFEFCKFHSERIRHSLPAEGSISEQVNQCSLQELLFVFEEMEQIPWMVNNFGDQISNESQFCKSNLV
jgi:hypothetical protein